MEDLLVSMLFPKFTPSATVSENRQHVAIRATPATLVPQSSQSSQNSRGARGLVTGADLKTFVETTSKRPCVWCKHFDFVTRCATYPRFELPFPTRECRCVHYRPRKR